jgi:serine/threonine protein kinase/tetratricopeptide (TPR) repeat protein
MKREDSTRTDIPSRGVGAESDPRICLVCGTRLLSTDELCPLCLLETALSESCPPTGSSSKEDFEERTGELRSHRFDQYELVRDKEGKPLELGRGAMGVTYKAFDVDLRCHVALKVISERYLGDESALLRFLREARAAASVRHQNVASVFHLGKSGENYFYAMEFLQGETLESLIKRAGRLEVNLALEIATQVAAGLRAVHKQKLVHRDIKPSNIMLSFEEGDAVIAKIIDLGLAKAVSGPGSQTVISTPGAFVGTPDFASPEQFTGIGVDIRSDLYSLGVTLWTMVTGNAPFRGSPAEVIYQHQYAHLPLKQLDGLPQPVAALLEMLLEKEPVRRFQSPVQLLNMMPEIKGAIDARRRISPQRFQEMSPRAWRARTRRPSAGPGPKRVSIARLPVTASDVFGREEDIAFLDDAWATRRLNVVTIVAWAGVGKSTLVNHWLGRMAAENYRSAELVFGWSFYRQGTSRGSSSADEFLDAALSWFGDPNPRIGTEWEKGERLAKLVAHCRTLLVLDGLEPLQNPPGPQEGRLREPSLQALLRELAAFNKGLCVITSRMPVADIPAHEGTPALRRDLEQLSSDAGAKLLRALGVTGDEAELRSASDEFCGHCLALTLLGSYLTDAYHGNIRFRKEVSERLAHDVRQGIHARKVMESYQTWFGEGAELSVLRILGLFDRPADELALEALLKPPAILGLTESFTNLRPMEWQTILARLRRARLLAGEDPYNRGHLDTHPLVREYFGEQLQRERPEVWKESNRRLYHHYRTLAPQLPDTFREMEPLFLAVICGCHAGLLREALHDVYLPRIQRGNASFAANVLGARGALLSVLAQFFEYGDWASPVRIGKEGQSLVPEDQLLILTHAALYLATTRGYSAQEVRICYQRVESLSHSLNRPMLLYSALISQWRYSLLTGRLSETMKIAKRLHSLAQEQNEPALMIGAYRALAVTLSRMGDFEHALEYAIGGVQIWRSGGVSHLEDVNAPAVICPCYEALSEWQFGKIALCEATMAEAISLAKELNDMHSLAVALYTAAVLGHFNRNPTEVESRSSELMNLSTREGFVFWLAGGKILRGWAKSISGNAAEAIAWIEDGIEGWRATGSMLIMPYWLSLKAEALHFAGCTSGALEAINEAAALIKRSEERWWYAELQRLRGIFLAALGAEESQIETSFCAAIKTAKEQNSVSLEKLAEATYA